MKFPDSDKVRHRQHAGELGPGVLRGEAAQTVDVDDAMPGGPEFVWHHSAHPRRLPWREDGHMHRARPVLPGERQTVEHSRARVAEHLPLAVAGGVRAAQCAVVAEVGVHCPDPADRPLQIRPVEPVPRQPGRPCLCVGEPVGRELAGRWSLGRRSPCRRTSLRCPLLRCSLLGRLLLRRSVFPCPVLRHVSCPRSVCRHVTRSRPALQRPVLRRAVRSRPACSRLVRSCPAPIHPPYPPVRPLRSLSPWVHLDPLALPPGLFHNPAICSSLLPAKRREKSGKGEEPIA